MINKQLINLSSPASSGAGTGNQEEGLILHLDANDVDSYDGDGNEWVDITNHEYTPATNVSEHFNTVTYTGTGTTNPITVGFQPDLIWVKNRDQTDSHAIVDSVRGITSPVPYIASDQTNAEATSPNMVTSVQSDGFTITGSGGRTNVSGEDYVAWCFKAGGAAVSNTDGTITSQVSANNDLGFSIVKYTGNLNNTTSATGAPIGHGLGTTPELIIFKNLGTTTNWHVYSKDLANWGTRLYLNETSAADNVYSSYPIANPTGSVFYTNYLTAQNVNNHNYIAYCFTSKRGVSKVGSYVGTGVAGNKVYTGFEPAFIMTKRSSSAGDNWNIIDNVRDTDPDKNSYLRANLADAEVSSSTSITFNRDGFTLNGGSFNTSSQTHIYYAVAKNTNETSLIPNTDLELHLDAASYSGSGSTWTANTGSNATITNASYDQELGDFFDLDGSGDFIDTNNTHGYITQTHEIWVKADTIQRQYIVSNYGSGTIPQGAMYFEMTSSGTIEAGVRNSSGSTSSLTTSTALSANKWYHLCYTSDGSNLKFYINGELDSTQSATVNTLASNSQNLIIGYDPRNISLYLNGQVGQFRTYSSALTQDQIRQNYNFTKNDYPNGFNGAITGATFNPDGYFDFDGSTNDVTIKTIDMFHGDFTLSMWWKLDSLSGYQMLFGLQGYGDSSQSGFGHYINGSTIHTWAQIPSSSVEIGRSGNILSTGVWHHIVLVREGSTWKHYLDGDLESTYTNKTTIAMNSQNGKIGEHYNNSGYNTDGKCSKVKVYDRALSDSEITDLYNEGE